MKRILAILAILAFEFTAPELVWKDSMVQIGLRNIAFSTGDNGTKYALGVRTRVHKKDSVERMEYTIIWWI